MTQYSKLVCSEYCARTLKQHVVLYFMSVFAKYLSFKNLLSPLDNALS